MKSSRRRAVTEAAAPQSRGRVLKTRKFSLVEPLLSARPLTCRLCHKEFKRITPSHLRFRHRVGLETYKTRFPNAALTSGDMREEMSQYISSYWAGQGRHWTRQRVKDLLSKDARRGLPLHVEAVMKRNGRLYSAGVRRFGSWDNALRVSGFDPRSIRRRQNWSCEDLLSEVRKAHGAGNLQRRTDLMSAARSLFGSWRQALSLAGLRARRAPAIRWTRDLVTSAIQNRVRDGLSLNASKVHDQAAPLWRAARRLFRKRWAELVKSLGLPYWGKEPWTRERVLDSLLLAASRTKSLRRCDILRACPGLVSAGVRLFGTWTRTVSASGLVRRGRSR